MSKKEKTSSILESIRKKMKKIEDTPDDNLESGDEFEYLESDDTQPQAQSPENAPDESSIEDLDKELGLEVMSENNLNDNEVETQNIESTILDENLEADSHSGNNQAQAAAPTQEAKNDLDLDLDDIDIDDLDIKETKANSHNQAQAATPTQAAKNDLDLDLDDIDIDDLDIKETKANSHNQAQAATPTQAAKNDLDLDLDDIDIDDLDIKETKAESEADTKVAKETINEVEKTSIPEPAEKDVEKEINDATTPLSSQLTETTSLQEESTTQNLPESEISVEEEIDEVHIEDLDLHDNNDGEIDIDLDIDVDEKEDANQTPTTTETITESRQDVAKNDEIDDIDSELAALDDLDIDNEMDKISNSPKPAQHDSETKTAETTASKNSNSEGKSDTTTDSLSDVNNIDLDDKEEELLSQSNQPAEDKAVNPPRHIAKQKENTEDNLDETVVKHDVDSEYHHDQARSSHQQSDTTAQHDHHYDHHEHHYHDEHYHPETVVDLVYSIIEPKIEDWLNQNLKTIVEEVVRDEVRKSAQKK